MPRNRNRYILFAMRFTVFALLLCLLSLPALAQEKESYVFVPPGTNFKNETADYVRDLQRKSLQENGFIKPTLIEVSLVHYTYMDPDQFGILMTVPDVVSGCWDISPLQYEANFIDPYYLDVKVKDYQRKVIETSNVQSGCPAGNKMATALLVLSKSDLEKRQIRQIRFTSGFSADYYDLIYGNNTLQLKPQSMVVFKAKNLEGAMKDRMGISFDGTGRVALHVPMATKDDNVAAAVRQFALRNALTPDADNAMSYSASGSPVFYYYDVTGRILGQVGDDGYAPVGTITAARPYDGPTGRTQIGVPLQVFATRPGTNL